MSTITAPVSTPLPWGPRGDWGPFSRGSRPTVFGGLWDQDEIGDGRISKTITAPSSQSPPLSLRVRAGTGDPFPGDLIPTVLGGLWDQDDRKPSLPRLPSPHPSPFGPERGLGTLPREISSLRSSRALWDQDEMKDGRISQTILHLK